MKNKIKKPVTYAFIDASNIIYGASDHGWKMDFAKFIKYLRERFNAEEIFYYAGIDQENRKQLRFYEKLQEFGYKLRLVPLKTFKDGNVKGDVDSRMTFEMMKYKDEYDHAVVLTGDGDYYWVLEYLLVEKEQVLLLSFPERTARDLKRLFGGRFTDINKIRKFVELTDQIKMGQTLLKDLSRGIISKSYQKKNKLSRRDTIL